jgi:NAD(P)-dependent dehydrogenase (short-subunit alcohol dehydrogenase family)
VTGRLARLASRTLARILDPTIVLSFDRTGYRLHSASFDPEALSVDLNGKVCLVTGANSGIGFATSSALADRGATVRLLCRSHERGEDAARQIRRATGSRRVHADLLDVSSLPAVRRFADDFPGGRVDVLVHCAGVLPDRRQETPDGIELTLATNVVGPFLLTELLLPRLRAAGEARVVLISSGGMYTQRLSVEDWRWKARPFDGVVAYAQTKRMQVVLAELWAERHRADGIAFNAMHPGWADTAAVRTSLPRFWKTMRPLLRTPEEGADTVVWLAASQAAAGRSGLFWFDRQPRPTHLLPWTREAAGERERLLDLCSRLTR